MRFGNLQLGLAAALLIGLAVTAPGAVRGEPVCTCRYAGQSYALDVCMCLVTPSGARMACCGQVLNNSSWNFTGDACPVATAPAEDSTSHPTPASAMRLDLARFYL